MVNDNEEMEKIVCYMDSLVTTINPDLDAPLPNNQLCQKCLKDLNVNMQDYIELINKLQRYTYCSSYYL